MGPSQGQLAWTGSPRNNVCHLGILVSFHMHQGCPAAQTPEPPVSPSVMMSGGRPAPSRLGLVRAPAQ